MPPPPPFPAPRPFPADPEPRMRNAGYFSGRNGSMGRKFGAFFGNGDRAGFERRNVLGAFAGTNGGEAGVERRKVATQREKKVWVAVEKKGGNGSDEDQAADGGGYAGRDERGLEAEEQLEPEEVQDGNGGLPGEDVESSLVIAGGDHECHEDGKLPNEHISSQSIQATHLRIRMRRRWVECRHDIGTFTSGLLSIYESLKPSEEHKSKQKLLVDSLAKSVSKKWPNAQLHLYGSCANSFGTSHSDVDVCLEIEIGIGSATEVLLALAEILRTDNFENVEAITGARVPIVRMSDPGSGFSCDICVNNLFAVANTKLLKDYAQIDERLLQLAFIVKHWAKLRGVNQTYRGTLSSYAYVLMCINFLQLREPKILPCLQDKMAPYFAPAFRSIMLIQAMEPTYTMVVDDSECAYFDEVHQFLDLGAENKESIAELLWAFFHYWAFHHDYGNDVISVRMGKTVSKQEKNWTTRVGNDRHLMCIEDPFETSHDLGRAVDRQTIRILREEFERAAGVLQYDDDPCVALFEPYDHDL